MARRPAPARAGAGRGDRGHRRRQLPGPLMGDSAPLLSAVGVLAGVVAMMVDGRRAVAIAVVFLAAGMAPTAATFGGAPGVAVLGAAAVAAVVFAWAGFIGGRRLPWVAGL